MTGTPRRVLIVDDDPGIRKLLARCAQSAGWEAVSAASGPEALLAFAAGKFDLLLSDVDLIGDMDGIAAAAQIRESAPGLRVVMMSGLSANSQKVAAAGLETFLPKPLDFAAIAGLFGPDRKAPPPRRPNCILLVEDDPSVRDLLALHIDTAGWEVVAAKNGAEALQAFEAGKFRLLLADVRLDAGMDGIELARRILSLEPGLKVVMMSGVPGIAEKVKAAGLGTFLPKPLGLAALAEALGLDRAHHESGRRKHILVVEDDAVQLAALTRRLESGGYAVTGAASAEAALALAGSGRFDVILSDNVLPGMTGLRAIPELRKLSKAPIVIMTSHPSPDLEKDARLLGATAFLAKPLDFERLDHALEGRLPPA